MVTLFDPVKEFCQNMLAVWHANDCKLPYVWKVLPYNRKQFPNGDQVRGFVPGGSTLKMGELAFIHKYFQFDTLVKQWLEIEETSKGMGNWSPRTDKETAQPPVVTNRARKTQREIAWSSLVVRGALRNFRSAGINRGRKLPQLLKWTVFQRYGTRSPGK